MSTPNNDAPKLMNEGRVPTPTGFMTVASKETDARVAPVQPPGTMKPALAGVLGLLTVLTAMPGAVLASITASGAPLPPWLSWLPAVAIVSTGFSPLLAAGAYWAAGGNPLDILKRFAPKVPGAEPVPAAVESSERKGPNP